MTFEQWELEVPPEIKADTLWRVKAYRIALFLSELAWHDTIKLVKDRRMFAIADQLFRAASNISSNVAEGYSRGTGKDRARFYEYALGSVREARDWYCKSRYVLEGIVVSHRLGLYSELAKLLLTMISKERTTNRRIRVND